VVGRFNLRSEVEGRREKRKKHLSSGGRPKGNTGTCPCYGMQEKEGLTRLVHWGLRFVLSTMNGSGGGKSAV